MPKVHRLTDPNAAGGNVTGTAPNNNVYANNLLIAIDGSTVSPDSSCNNGNIHCAPNTANGGPTVFAHNIEVNSAGDPDTCGHPRATGSPNVFTDGGGGGAMFDNSDPLPGAPIIPLPTGRQFIPTQQDQYVFENNDVPEEINPSPQVAHPEYNSEVKDLAEEESDDTQPPPNVPPAQDCSSIDTLPSNYVYTDDESDFDTWASGFVLSPNYTVYDLTVGPAVSTYRFTTSVVQASGLTQKQILQNLCFLAKTALEPMRSRYGDFTITSGWRNKSGGSQHNRGQAVDIQIFSFHGTGQTGQLYYNRAQDVRDNINYDQMILEWFGRNPWIHVSTNSSGHRKSVLTQTSSSSYAPGLRRLG